VVLRRAAFGELAAFAFFRDHVDKQTGNDSPTFVEPFAPFSGSCPKGATRFYPNGSRRPLSLP
jgi:hypothetical protein